MSTEIGYLPGVGSYIMTTAKRGKVIPSHERHKWDKAPKRGETATCQKCGCRKIHQFNYVTVYQAAGSPVKTPGRPPCTGAAL